MNKNSKKEAMKEALRGFLNQANYNYNTWLNKSNEYGEEVRENPVRPIEDIVKLLGKIRLPEIRFPRIKPSRLSSLTSDDFSTGGGGANPYDIRKGFMGK